MDYREVMNSHAKWLMGDSAGERADLSRANLRWADLSGANLRGADLRGADLRWANLRGADLSEANLRGANLSEADLRWANLRGADLRGATGLLEPFAWIEEHFETTEQGVIVFRAQSGQYANPYGWAFEPGASLTEVCHSDRSLDCACGVAFATLEWVRKNHPNDTIWRCLIPWERSCGIVVPYNTDGKARCDYLELIEVVEQGDNEA